MKVALSFMQLCSSVLVGSSDPTSGVVCPVRRAAGVSRQGLRRTQKLASSAVHFKKWRLERSAQAVMASARRARGNLRATTGLLRRLRRLAMTFAAKMKCTARPL
jgi:hypothetical protein